MSKILLLYSGGADSRLMLSLAKEISEDDISALIFDYGQIHKEEIHFAIEHLHDANVDCTIIIASDCFKYIKSNLLQNSHASYEGVHEKHVPARNLLFLGMALGWAESNCYDEIWIGCNYDDRINLFPDCTQEWIVKINELAAINGSRKIKIKAPLLGMEKKDILLLLEKRGVKKCDLFSGYERNENE